jgi:hypothetical protein
MTKDEYSQNPKHCPQCNKEIPWEKKENKFCSSSCSATYTQTGVKRPDSHRKAIAEAINKYNLSVGKTKKPKLAKVKVAKEKPQPVAKPKKPTNAMVEEKNNFDIAAYKVLYPDVVGVVGVYKKTGRYKPRLSIVVSFINRKPQTRSYPRAIYEIHIGRVLDYPNETVDHIDSDPMNNDLSNLQILSLFDNIKKAQADGLGNRPKKKDIVNEPIMKVNGNSLLTADQVISYRKMYSDGVNKNEIMTLSGLSRRATAAFLFGRTYKHLPFVCSKE